MVVVSTNNKLTTQTAKVLLKKIRTNQHQVHQKILNLPYLNGLEQGERADSVLRSFIGNQYHLMHSIVGADAQMKKRFTNTELANYFEQMLRSELEASRALLLLAQTLGMSEESLETYETEPDALAYGYYVSSLATNGSLAEIVASLGVNFPIWAGNCQRISMVLRQLYGFNSSQTRFFDIFAEASSSIDDGPVIKAISLGLGAGVSEEKIARSVRLIQGYELRFWDAMASTMDVDKSQSQEVNDE